MANETPRASHAFAGSGLIFLGLGLALLGATSASLFVLGMSHLYFSRFSVSFVELGGFLLSSGAFARYYGRYLDQLEKWTSSQSVDSALRPLLPPVTEAEPLPFSGATRSIHIDEPKQAGVVAAACATIYGLFFGASALIWTNGKARILNLLAVGVLISLSTVLASTTWRRRRVHEESDTQES